MSERESERRTRHDEEHIRNSAVEIMLASIGKIREIGPAVIRPGIKDLRKLPVNASMPADEREEQISRNNRLYYEILHDPRLGQEGIYPDMDTIITTDIPTNKGRFNMSSIRLGEEASLVRMTLYDHDDQPTEFRVHLWYPAVSSEEWMFDHTGQGS